MVPKKYEVLLKEVGRLYSLKRYKEAKDCLEGIIFSANVKNYGISRLIYKLINHTGLDN